MTTPGNSSLRRGSRLLAAAAAGWLALAGLTVDAAPHGTGTTRAALARWLDSLRVSGTIDIAKPSAWHYVFSGSESPSLEALSVELVGAGYSIASLAPLGDGARLVLARTELHTPASLERRNRDLAAVAQQHGVRYDGVDAAPGP